MSDHRRDGEKTVVVGGTPHETVDLVDEGPMADSRRGPGPLEVGTAFGRRYRIEEELGVGGMGAVYRAWDQDLDIPVALKVIRLEIAGNEEATIALGRRFKRELLLARQVTHRNVVRIHDLGDIDGIKYITMSYIEGEDLASILAREGTLPVPEALRITRAVVSGLEAAHEAGVIHRDLKPANIMIEENTGEPFIMDFGIARSDTRVVTNGAKDEGMAAVPSTRTSGRDTGASGVVGTLRYMAPEQFLGQRVDQRADIYALGLIFYDMLLGAHRSEVEKSEADGLRSRLETSPPRPVTVDDSIPDGVDRFITRSIETEPDNRYQSTTDLASDLDRLDDAGVPLPISRLLTGKVVIGAVAVVIALLVGTWWIASQRAPPTEHEPLSVLIADFDNQTGDASFDGAIEQALAIAIEEAAFISAYSRPNAQRIAEQLQPGSPLDESLARLVSRREGLSLVVAGSIAETGGEYWLTVRALDPGLEPGEGRPLAEAKAKASSAEAVLSAVAEIASDLRGELGDSTSASDRLAAAETFTAASLGAMQAYSRGQDLAVQGKFEEALKAYQEAIDEDPDFGRAYSGMGVVYGNLRQEVEAEESYQKALQHLDRMTERERYRTLGGYYLLVSHNYEKAIENYQMLVDRYPADGGAYSNLGYAYHMARRFDRAVEAGRTSVELDPGNLIKRINYAIYATNAGDFQTSIKESETVHEQNPDFGYALFTLGRAAAAEGDADTARDAFTRLEESGGMGSSLAPMAMADMEMTGGRYGRAVGILESAIATNDNPFQTATMLVALAEAQLQLSRLDAATAAADRAVGLSRHESVQYLAARVFMAAGRGETADAIGVELENRLQSQTTALSALIRGERFLHAGHLGTAMREFRWAREEYEFWFVHYLAGLAYMEAEQFPEAFDEFDACVRNKGEATDVFLVDSATLRYYPRALYWLGRTHDALGNPEAAKALYDEYNDLRADADPRDPLVVDARDR